MKKKISQAPNKSADCGLKYKKKLWILMGTIKIHIWVPSSRFWIIQIFLDDLLFNL